MRTLLFGLLLFPQATPQAGLYDPDPEHLWNRIHRAIHGWHYRHQEQSRDPDSLHWPAHLSDLSGESQLSLGPLLDEFVAKKGDDLVRDPLRRAVLQRDLWMMYVWSFQTERNGDVWDRKSNEQAEVDKAKHRELRKKLVLVLRKIALSVEQIRALPDTLAAAAKAYPLSKPPQTGEAYVPADLLDPKGPWVVLGNAAGGPLAVAPADFFEGRAAFTIFLKLPSGRKATEDYAKKIGGWPMEKLGDIPECPPGTQVALLRQSLLISDRGFPIESPLTETLELRTLGSPENDLRNNMGVKFQLRRAKLFAGEAGGLVPAGPKDQDSNFILLIGHNKVDEPAPVVRSCAECHAGTGITSLETVFSIRRRVRAILTPSTFEEENWQNGTWNFHRHSFGQLKAIWPD